MVAWSLLQVDHNYLQLSETAGLTWWQTCGSRGQDKQTSSNMLSFFISWCRIQTLTPNNARFPCPSRLQVYRHTLWLGHVCNPRYAVHKELFTKDSRTCSNAARWQDLKCSADLSKSGAHTIHPSILFCIKKLTQPPFEDTVYDISDFGTLICCIPSSINIIHR